MAKAPAIGIDLGTTCWFVDLAYTNTERLIGDAAKKQVTMNPNNTIFV